MYHLSAASPWVKVLERPGDEHGNRSEEVAIENPYKNKDSPDTSYDVPEKVWRRAEGGGRCCCRRAANTNLTLLVVCPLLLHAHTQNPDTQPQAPIDPEMMAAAEANKHSDSVRIMAGKLNEAVGGE